jgi:alkyl hydroperoxide reductase subunit AhpC
MCLLKAKSYDFFIHIKTNVYKKLNMLYTLNRKRALDMRALFIIGIAGMVRLIIFIPIFLHSY